MFEFSAPVVGEEGVLGTILYGLSSARLRGALERARADARYAALRTVALLALLGVGGLALGLSAGPAGRRADHRPHRAS